MSRGISKDQKLGKDGTPETTKGHRYKQHNVIQKAKKLPSKANEV